MKINQLLDWNKSGLFVSAFEKTKVKFYSVNTKTGSAEIYSDTQLDLPGGIHLAKIQMRSHYQEEVIPGLNEIYSWRLKQPLKQITNSYRPDQRLEYTSK